MVFRWLASNWLQSAAREQVRARVVQAAREQVASAMEEKTEGAEPEARPCEVGIIFALGTEAGGLEDLLEAATARIRGAGFTVQQGRLTGRSVTLIVSGAGRQAAAGATEALIQAHRPPLVVSAGFAGALGPELKRYDLVLPDRVVDLEGNRIEIATAAPAAAQGVARGALLTADRIIRSPEEKRSLGRKFAAVAVDMETFAVAEVCRAREVPFLALRAISDAVDDELPADVERLTRQKTSAARAGAALGAIFNRPGSLQEMLNLKEHALVASDRLAKSLAALVKG